MIELGVHKTSVQWVPIVSRSPVIRRDVFPAGDIKSLITIWCGRKYWVDSPTDMKYKLIADTDMGLLAHCDL